MMVGLRTVCTAALVEVSCPREDSHDGAIHGFYTTDFHQLAESHGDQIATRLRINPIFVMNREM
eukprot:15708866-Heterocapsa_arctica.AAC.1